MLRLILHPLVSPRFDWHPCPVLMLRIGPQVVMQIEDAFTARFEDVMVDAGADVSVTLHFGGKSDICPVLGVIALTWSPIISVGDVPVTITPRQHLIDIPVSYIGPLLCACGPRLQPRSVH